MPISRSPRLFPQRPAIFLAHRGASHMAPENTEPAFAKAIDLFSQAQAKFPSRLLRHGLEFDIMPCFGGRGEGRIVIHHDDEIGRTAKYHDLLGTWGFAPDSRPARIHEIPWHILSQLDVGSHKGSQWQGIRVPLFHEVLRYVLPHTLLNVEVKRNEVTYESDGFEDRVLDALENLGLRDRTIVHSFDHGFMFRFRARARELGVAQHYPLGIALWAKDFGQFPGVRATLPVDYLILEQSEDLQEHVRMAHAQHVGVLVWTVNTTAEIRRVLAAGADGIYSDRPELLTDAEFPEDLREGFFFPPVEEAQRSRGIRPATGFPYRLRPRINAMVTGTVDRVQSLQMDFNGADQAAKGRFSRGFHLPLLTLDPWESVLRPQVLGPLCERFHQVHLELALNKTDAHAEFIRKLQAQLDTLPRWDGPSRLLISSNHHPLVQDLLQERQEIRPRFRVGVVLEGGYEQSAARFFGSGGVDFVVLRDGFGDVADDVEQVRKGSCEVLVRVSSDRHCVRKLINLGVDGLIFSEFQEIFAIAPDLRTHFLLR